MDNKNDNFELIYSPRTSLSMIRDKEEKIFNDLKIGFDPYTIKIMKKHYKEHLGKLNKETFISILKRHLLTWHPNLPNRSEVLVKLLSRLFDEIDLNSNGDLEWDEFVNYIINSSYHQNYQNSIYNLQQYALSKDIFQHQDKENNVEEIKFNYMSDKNVDVISYCFYINKYKLIGVVHDGKSRIIFFDADSNQRENIIIDLIMTQTEIDQLEINELNKKTEVKLQKELIEKKEKNRFYNLENNRMLKINQGGEYNSLSHSFNKSRSKSPSKSQSKSRNNSNEKIKMKSRSKSKSKDSKKNSLNNSNDQNNNDSNNNNTKNNKDKKNKRPETPESIKWEIFRINNTGKKIDESKRPKKNGLYALNTCFIDEYDLLFISSNNNKISAWKFEYKNYSFVNVNKISYKSYLDFHFEIHRLSIPLFCTKLPQHTMSFDPPMKALYSGQEDGKILKWEMHTPSPTHIFDIHDEKISVLIKNLTLSNNASSSLERDVTDEKEKELKENGNNKDDFIHGKTTKGGTVVTTRNRKKYKSLKGATSTNIASGTEKKSGKEMDKEREQFSKIAKNTKSITTFKHNRDTVSCLIILDRLRLLCSSYYNGQIIFWDVMAKKPRKVFNDQQTGIYTMVFDPNKNQIFTCGFEHEIFVYEPYNNNTAVYKLKGHNGSICSLSINPEISELISIDILGVIKVWDTQNFYNFQTLNTHDTLLMQQNKIKKTTEQNALTNKKKISSDCFVLSLQNVKKFMVYGEKFLLYEKGKDKNPDLTDDNPILGSVFNYLSKDLVTFSNRRIKIWNIFTGKVKKVYEDLMKGNEITAFTCDKPMKRFYIGDNVGHVKGFNMSTGDFIKDFASHEREIINVIHSMKYELLITCSADLCVKFQDDKELLTTEIIKEMYARPTNSLYYSDQAVLKLKITILDEDDGVLVIGLSNGLIMHYDVGHYKYILNPNEDQEEILFTKQVPISNMTDIDEVQALFVAYENGEKCFTAKTKNKFYSYLAGEKFGIFLDDETDIPSMEEEKKRNGGGGRYFRPVETPPQETKKKNIIISSAYDQISHRLLTGDHTGLISCYDLMSLINFMNDENIPKLKEEEVRKRIHNDIRLNLIYKVQAHSETIKYICIPEELYPKIIISTSNDRTVRLLNFDTGEYIDALKQISIKYSSIPIGIKYAKNNPFINKEAMLREKKEREEQERLNRMNSLTNAEIKDLNEKEKEEKRRLLEEKKKVRFQTIRKFDLEDENYKIIYKNDIKGSLQLPKINYDEAGHNEIINYFDKIMEYNAKVQLLNCAKGQKIPSHKSNPWNFEVNIEALMEKNEEELRNLLNVVNMKESETDQTEKNHQLFSIFNQNYTPAFIDNLEKEEKYELKDQINSKIRNINLAISKSITLKKEMEAIEKFRNRNKNKSSVPTPMDRINAQFDSKIKSVEKILEKIRSQSGKESKDQSKSRSKSKSKSRSKSGKNKENQKTNKNNINDSNINNKKYILSPVKNIKGKKFLSNNSLANNNRYNYNYFYNDINSLNNNNNSNTNISNISNIKKIKNGLGASASCSSVLTSGGRCSNKLSSQNAISTTQNIIFGSSIFPKTEADKYLTNTINQSLSATMRDNPGLTGLSTIFNSRALKMNSSLGRFGITGLTGKKVRSSSTQNTKGGSKNKKNLAGTNTGIGEGGEGQFPDLRFQEWKEKFEEKCCELYLPFINLLRKQQKPKFLPKLRRSNTRQDN